MSRLSRFIILLLISSSVIFVSTHPLTENQYSPTSDEGYYYHYADLISRKGLSGFQELIDWYAGSEKARYHPTPSRVGYILITAACFKIFGPSYSLLGLISLTCFLLFLWVSFHFCRKHFDTDTALLLTLFLSSSPLMLAMSHRALTDSATNLLWGTAVWLFLDFLINPNKKNYIALLLSLSLALLMKESSIVLLMFMLIAGLIYKYRHPRSLNLAHLFSIIIAPTIITGIVSIAIFGGVTNSITAAHSIFTTHTQAQYSNPYAANYCTGPWYRYIVDYLLLTPLTTLLFIGYSFFLFIERKFEWKTMYFFLYFNIIYILLNGLKYTKVVRFITNLEMVMSLFAVFMLYELLRSKYPIVTTHRVLAAAMLIFIINIRSFFDLFYGSGLLDPTSFNLLVLREMIPSR